MVETFKDLTEPRWDSNLPRPRGLLPVPPHIEELVASEKVRLQPYVNEEAEKRMRDDWTLHYYYEGEAVVYRVTPQGVEVLAVGLDEVGKLVRGMTQEELLQITSAQL
jgi:hypothetical protein